MKSEQPVFGNRMTMPENSFWNHGSQYCQRQKNLRGKSFETIVIWIISFLQCIWVLQGQKWCLISPFKGSDNSGTLQDMWSNAQPPLCCIACCTESIISFRILFCFLVLTNFANTVILFYLLLLFVDAVYILKLMKLISYRSVKRTLICSYCFCFHFYAWNTFSLNSLSVLFIL